MDAKKQALEAIIKYASGLLVEGRKPKEDVPPEGEDFPADEMVEEMAEEMPLEEEEPEEEPAITILKAGRIGAPSSMGMGHKMPVKKKRFGGY